MPTGAPQLGDALLNADTAGLTVLVVGDSLARSIGVGIANVSAQNHITAINAAMGGCGIMLSSRFEAPSGQISPTPDSCNNWPTVWPELVSKYQPTAVYLTTAFWDVAPQEIAGSNQFQTFADPAFRATYAKNIDRAIALLTAGGATVFLDDMNDNNTANAEPDAVARNAGPKVKLLWLREQLCNAAGCPPVIGGIKVLDDTGHPAGESQNRLARWVLNQMAAQVSKPK
jgi:hypothetical protein